MQFLQPFNFVTTILLLDILAYLLNEGAIIQLLFNLFLIHFLPIIIFIPLSLAQETLHFLDQRFHKDSITVIV